MRVATSGNEALALLQAEKVDLVITDLVMPGMDGMTLVRAIRNSDPGMKVIILTAYGSVESMAESKTLGVAHYLTKPFDLFHLKSRVKMLLRGPEPVCGGDRARTLYAVCSVVGKAAGMVSALPRKALPYVQPERWIVAAGAAAGTVSGLCRVIRRRFLEVR